MIVVALLSGVVTQIQGAGNTLSGVGEPRGGHRGWLSAAVICCQHLSPEGMHFVKTLRL